MFLGPSYVPLLFWTLFEYNTPLLSSLFKKVFFCFWMSYNLKLNCIFRQWHTVAHHVISPFLFQDPLLGSSLMIIELLSSHQLWNPFRTDYLTHWWLKKSGAWGKVWGNHEMPAKMDSLFKSLIFCYFWPCFLYFCSSLKSTTVWKIGAAQKLFMHPSGGWNENHGVALYECASITPLLVACFGDPFLL